jgi:uncharacterized protein
MPKASREFQVFAKPAGPICNLDCSYCYYSKKASFLGYGKLSTMSDRILEEYIAQHINASPGPVIRFSWHGGEPTLAGLDYFEKIVSLQHKHKPPDRLITNGMQTNGTLLDDEWCRFLAREGFSIGVSLDGPKEMHDQYRVSKSGEPTFERAMRGYRLLQQYGIPKDILCVVHEGNVHHPMEVYKFFREIGAEYIGFLPLVEQLPGRIGVSTHTPPAEAFGNFLCTIFDEWTSRDIGRIKVQIFEETAAMALGQEHSLCIFRKTCGDIPVIEHNGDFFSCDHFVDSEHRLGNILETPLAGLIESKEQRAFGKAKLDTLPCPCRGCEVLALCNGGCPKDRFTRTPEGKPGLNYLCAGYKRFFNHCRPFLAQIAGLRRQQVEAVPAPTQGKVKTGRNDPCPCGSGRKYKKCCFGKNLTFSASP